MRSTKVGWLVAAVMTPTLASSAEVTDMPIGLRGDIHLDYDGNFTTGGLDEADTRIGRRSVERHGFDVRAEFAPTDGVAVVLGVPTTLTERYWFPSAHQMIYDPVYTLGTYDITNEITGPVYQGGGAHGFLIGVAVAPFTEAYRRNFRVTWRLDLAYRTPAPKQTLYTGADGERGAAPGGHGLVLGAAFSSRRGHSDTYVDFDFCWESPASVDVIDNDGTLIERGLQIYPASTVDLVTGVELIAAENDAIGSRVAIDLFTAFGYRSWADVPSGFVLPSVLDASRHFPVTTSDHVLFRVGWGIDYDINQWIGLHTDVYGGYHTPYQLENVYEVYTGTDTFEVGWRFSLVGKVRLKDD